jgi:acyl dehydratase
MSQTFFEDVNIGENIPPLVLAPLTSSHLMRWSATSENFHRIHYDRNFAQGHDKLPDLLINGSLKQQFLATFIKDWAGPGGWPWKISFQFRAMNVVGEQLTIWGKITNKRDLADYGLVDLDIGIRSEHDKESTPGKSTVALPYRNGKPVPYPFVPPNLAP